MANADRDHLTVGLFVTPNYFYKVSVTIRQSATGMIYLPRGPRVRSYATAGKAKAGASFR